MSHEYSEEAEQSEAEAMEGPPLPVSIPPRPGALQRIEVPPPAPLLSGVNIEGLLSKAVDAKAAVEVLERLAVMRREMKAEAAKEGYDRAMADFQAECPVIKKEEAVMNKDRTKGERYRYAPLDAIVTQTKGLLRKHGFSYTLTAEVEDKWVTAVVRVKHTLGHMEESKFKVPIDPESYMNAPQRFASALTFAKRYAFCNSFGILTGDGDDDARLTDPEHAAGQGQKPPTPSATQQKPTTPPATRTTQAATQAAPKPTEAMRTRAIDILVKKHESPVEAEKFVTEFLRKAGALMPNEPLEAWALQYVPTSQAEVDALREALKKFENGDKAEIPFHHQNGIGDQSPEPEKAKAKAKKPIEVPRDPDAGDQSTAPTEINPEWEKVTGTIDRTSYKSGSSRRGPWEMWGIKIGEDWYNTFSSRIGKLAEANKGREVDLYFSANERGKNAEHIEV
jgi:hypothetical protein